RIPITPALKQRLDDLFNVLFQVVQTDNEVNGLMAIQIISDLFKNFSNDLQGKIASFLQFAASLYSNIRGIMAVNFNSAVDRNSMRRAVDSFQVLCKCPVIITHLNTCHHEALQSAMVSLIHVMVLPLKFPVSQQFAQSHKQEYADCIDVQVKTLVCL